MRDTAEQGPALFEKACLFNDQHARGRAQMRHHIAAQRIPDSLGIPLGTAQQMLPAIRGGIASACGRCFRCCAPRD
jgi:hypothetical protein